MATSGSVHSTADPSIHLTNRQVEILGRLFAGMPPKQIGADLGICRETVDEHLDRAGRTLGTHGRIQLMRAAIYHGFVQAPTPGTAGPTSE